MTDKKKLIEVALPLDAINQASSREKSIRHGHPSTLHLWWARRPLATARAVIFAQMVDDPSARPDLFPNEADQQTERERLFRLIEQMVRWENTTNEKVLEQAREEIRESWRRCCADNAGHPQAEELFDPDRLPAFHDPFAGGGALPLEAQRLGLEAHASDLNPVAVLINKAMIEIPPRFAGRAPVNPEAQPGGPSSKPSLVEREWKGAQGLAEDVRYYGQWMRDEAEKRIGHLYPKVEVTEEMVRERPDLKPYRGRKLTVIAWLWARTVKSPNPAFADVDVPLVSTFMLSTKKGKEAYVEPMIEGRGYRFAVKAGTPADEEAAKAGTKLARGANFRCLMSGTALTAGYIRSEAQAGRMGSRLMAIVAEGDRGRVYLPPVDDHEAIPRLAKPVWKPDLKVPTPCHDVDRLPMYGMPTWGDAFTPRQLVALTTFADLVAEAMERVKEDYLGARASRPQRGQDALVPRGLLASSTSEAIGGAPSDSENAGSVRPSGVAPSSQYHRTGLPHFEAGEVPQHICFRLADSLPQSLLREWEEELQRLPETEQQNERRQRIEAALDQGHGVCWLQRPEIATLVRGALCHFNGDRYRLHGWVIMPNHVHVLVTPLGDHSLSGVVHSWKSYTATQANKLLGRSGPFWHADYFDRFMRDEGHFVTTLKYIHGNPVKAGLCTDPSAWEWTSYHTWDSPGGGEHLAVFGEGGTPSLPGSASTTAEDDRPLRDGGAGARAYAEAVGVYLAFAQSKACDRNTSLCRWEYRDKLVGTFSRQALPMVWDYAETNPFAGAGGDILGTAKSVCEVIEKQFRGGTAGLCFQVGAVQQAISTNKLISTDPPYYDNVGYADLSDFFYVWLRRQLRPIFPDLFATVAVPKTEELIATPYRHESKEEAEAFFLAGMTDAMRRIAEQAHPGFPVTIYYAFKQSETKGEAGTSSTGWETFLDAVIRAGFAVTGTWPMRTELGNRMISMGTNALASSIILVCRRRSDDAPLATRREFVAALKVELPAALAHLQAGNIAPVDLAQAAIGPGMAVYTRYAKVLDAEGKPVPVRDALALINQTLDETLAEQEGEFDADSRWALAWFEQHGFGEGEYGVAEMLSKAKNTSIAGIVEGGILASRAGKVRLLRPKELAEDWDPTADTRLTAWEVVHQLVRVLESGGETQAAALLKRLGGVGETARELAYRLYNIAERKGRPAEALSYNALVQSWPEIARLARQEAPGEQPGLFGDEDAGALT